MSERGERTTRPGANPLLVNAAELLREPGARRAVRTAVALADVDAGDPRLSGDVVVDLLLESSLDDVTVTGTLAVDWSDTCRRCLRDLADQLVVDVDERYVPVGAPDDPEAFPIEHGQLDLRPVVRENVLLGVPDAPLCRPDCPGLCPVCGIDLQTDPDDNHEPERDDRWAALDDLRVDE